MVEPVEDGGKANKAVKGDREFLVAGRDTAVALDPAEEVFDHMAMPVKFAVEADRRAPSAAGRDPVECAGAGERAAKAVRIESAVRDRPFSLQVRMKRCAGPKVVLLPRSKMQTYITAEASWRPIWLHMRAAGKLTR